MGVGPPLVRAAALVVAVATAAPVASGAAGVTSAAFPPAKWWDLAALAEEARIGPGGSRSSSALPAVPAPLLRALCAPRPGQGRAALLRATGAGTRVAPRQSRDSPVLRAGESSRAQSGPPAAASAVGAAVGASGPAAVTKLGRDRTLLPLPREYFLRLGGKEKFVVVSWTTGAKRKEEEGVLTRSWIAINLALSIRKHAPQLERRFAYVSLDGEAHRVLGEFGFNSVLCEPGVCRSTELSDDIWKMRWYLMRTITGFGLSVLVVDADIVFLTDPTRFLWHDSDMEVMTDHFYPERHLWEPWVRVEDHINTGFVFVRPTAPVRAMIADFLDASWEAERGFVRRDAMDQRVFNHFVVRRMAADVPTVIARYENLTFGRQQQIVPPAAFRQVSIRVLDPAVIAHGMNFFWRRAHLLPVAGGGIGGGAAVAHVNGADPKEYFLRDRGVWYVDDWFERFGDEPKFLLYTHPPGLTLAADFEHLQAAIETARLVGRRLVLPSTMNCRNSPAYRAWRLDETLQRPWEEGNCTFDYFSWAKHLLEVHGEHVVEAGLADHERFEALRAEDSVVHLLPVKDGAPRNAARVSELVPEGPAIVEVTGNIVAARNMLRRALRLEEWDTMRCIYQQFPHQVSVCRDDRYVGRFGKEAQCDPYAGQAACGLDGFTCCMAFWGFSEKLEIFTGARWDLPCNCGLGSQCLLTRAHPVDRDEQQYDRHCCAHGGQLPPQEHCMLVPQYRNFTVYGDSHFYSSYLMGDFVDGKIDPPRALERCMEHRAGTMLDSNTARGHLHCSHMITSLALWYGRYDRAFRWLEYVHWVRRRPGVERALSTETWRAEPELPDVWKALHDAEQWRHIAKLAPRFQVTPYAPIAPPEFARQLAQAYAQLASACREGPGEAQRQIETELAPLRPYLGRALHVPHVERIEAGAVRADADWAALDAALLRDGVGHIDGAMGSEALRQLVDYFIEATIWHGSRSGGAFLTASIRDGLHAELLLQVAAELAERLPGALGAAGMRLSDAYAQKYDAEWPGDARGGAHALPAGVVVLLWTTPDSAVLGGRRGREGAANGVEVFRAEAPRDMRDRYSWTPRLEDDPAKHALVQAEGFRSKSLAYRQNRLVVWRADRLFRSLWDPRRWRAGYKNRRVDLFLLFGQAPPMPP